MSERLHTQQDLQKTVKSRNCRVMEFVCLCLPSQIWVKQSQPAKHGTKLSPAKTPDTLWISWRDRSSPAIRVEMLNLIWSCALEEATKQKLKTEVWAETSVLLGHWYQSAKLLKCTMEEADVRCGPRLQEMYRPGHMEVDGGIQLVSTGPQRAYSSTQDEDWGVACPLPHKWTTQQNPPKGKS